MNEFHRKVIEFLREQGATDVEMTMGGEHPRIWYTWQKQRRFHVVPGSPSDNFHAIKNTLSDLRHSLGLIKTEKRVGERRPVRNKAQARRELPTGMTPGRDWQADLAQFRDNFVMQNQADCWLKFWRSCMKKVGGKSLI